MKNYEYVPIKKKKVSNTNNIFFLILTIIMFLGISLATVYFVYRYNDERENSMTSGLISLDFKEQSANINLENTVPMTDEAGKQNTPYRFTIENTSKIPLNVKIGLEISNNTIDLSAIKYALYIDNIETKVDNLGNLEADKILYEENAFPKGRRIEVKLVFWIDYYYENSGETFVGKIQVTGEQYDIIYDGS